MGELQSILYPVQPDRSLHVSTGNSTFFMYLPITSGTAQMVIMLPITVTLIHGHGVAYKTMHEEITSQKYKNKL